MVVSVRVLRSMHLFMSKHLDTKHKVFSYALEKNIAKVESALKKAEKVTRGMPCFARNVDFDSVYLPKWIQLENKYGSKDGSGRFLRDEHDRIIPSDADAYKTELDALNSKFPGFVDILDARIEAMSGSDELEFDIDFYKIRNENGLPDAISARDRINLRFMLDDSMIPEEILEEEKEELEENIQAPASEEIKEVRRGKRTKK